MFEQASSVTLYSSQCLYLKGFWRFPSNLENGLSEANVGKIWLTKLVQALFLEIFFVTLFRLRFHPLIVRFCYVVFFGSLVSLPNYIVFLRYLCFTVLFQVRKRSATRELRRVNSRLWASWKKLCRREICGWNFLENLDIFLENLDILWKFFLNGKPVHCDRH